MIGKEVIVENRKAFNFYRSYYDAYFKLPKEDRAAYIEAVLRKQFENQDPELEGMADLVYTAQRHSIEAQVNGYLSKIEGLQCTPKQGARQGGSNGALSQEKEKEKEQEKLLKRKRNDNDELRRVDDIAVDYLKNDQLIKAVLENNDFPVGSEKEIEELMQKFLIHLKSVDETLKKEKDFKSHFKNWVLKKEKSSGKEAEEDRRLRELHGV